MREDTRHGERLGALFLLGLVLFSPLMLRIFDAGGDVTFLGFPLLYFYVFVSWAVVIGLIIAIVERIPGLPPYRTESGQSEDEPL
jgi:hypothetical protein